MLNRFSRAALVLGLFAVAPPVLAGGEDVVVEDAWSRASIGTGRPGVAYMTLRNTGAEPVVVTGLRTDLAMMPMIHSTTTDAQGVTRMSHMEAVEIAAGEAVALAPGGWPRSVASARAVLHQTLALAARRSRAVRPRRARREGAQLAPETIRGLEPPRGRARAQSLLWLPVPL